jgi:hypothetical protein
MDAQFWIYIVIGAIYFLSRLLKKPEEGAGEAPDAQQPERRRPVQTQQSTQKPRQLTFEELLREITEGKQASKPAPAPQPRHTPQYENYDENLGEEARNLERVNFDEAENAAVFQKYEQAQALAKERRSLEESLRLEDTLVDFKRFEAFERKQKRNVLQDYVQIMRHPESLKRAVVMSEILKRKF